MHWKALTTLALAAGVAAEDPNLRSASNLERELFEPIKAFAPTRIIGGSLPSRDYEFFASLSQQGGNDITYSFYCGGSLIAKDWVLTAAHCVNQGDSGDYVTVGHDDLNQHGNAVQRRVSKTIVHPNYNSNTVQNDIALLKLNKPITNKPFAKYKFGSSYGPNDMLTVIGYGSRNGGSPGNPAPIDESIPDDKLLEVNVKWNSDSQCKNEYNSYGYDTKTMMCAGSQNKDACQGDSGGPIFARDANGENHQVGIVSWGIGCGQKGFSGVYSRLSKYENWIDGIIAGDGGGGSNPTSPPPSTWNDDYSSDGYSEYEYENSPTPSPASLSSDMVSPTNDWVLGATGKSCSQVCLENGKTCNNLKTKKANTKKAFINVLKSVGMEERCTGGWNTKNVYKDSPSMDISVDGTFSCYTNTKKTQCNAAWETSSRLCCCGPNCPLTAPTIAPTRRPTTLRPTQAPDPFNTAKTVVENVDSCDKLSSALAAAADGNPRFVVLKKGDLTCDEMTVPASATVSLTGPATLKLTGKLENLGSLQVSRVNLDFGTNGKLVATGSWTAFVGSSIKAMVPASTSLEGSFILIRSSLGTCGGDPSSYVQKDQASNTWANFCSPSASYPTPFPTSLGNYPTPYPAMAN